jgi:hypothetical protein
MKTFVRYAPGAGGTFLCLVLYALSNDIDADFENGNAHAYQDVYSRSHNFDSLAHEDCLVRDHESFKLFKKYTEEPYNDQYPNVQEGIQWFKDRLVFDSSERHYIRSHARTLNSIIPAVDNANIVNITIDDSDIDQMCYNFVTKAVITNPKWADERADDTLPVLTYWYPDKVVTINQLSQAIKNQDVKFLCWVIKLAWKNYWEKYSLYNPPSEFKIYNISWKDICNGTLSKTIDQLAAFLDITLTDARRKNAIALIENWNAGQVQCPFSISINDY